MMVETRRLKEKVGRRERWDFLAIYEIRNMTALQSGRSEEGGLVRRIRVYKS